MFDPKYPFVKIGYLIVRLSDISGIITCLDGNLDGIEIHMHGGQTYQAKGIPALNLLKIFNPDTFSLNQSFVKTNLNDKETKE